MGTIREPPKSLEEFEELSWSEKSQLREETPDVYWHFIGQIREIENRKEN